MLTGIPKNVTPAPNARVNIYTGLVLTDTLRLNTSIQPTASSRDQLGGGGGDLIGHRHGERQVGPSGSGTVVLDLGPGSGALVLHTPEDLEGAEIEISHAGSAHRKHSMVRPRHVAGGTQYAAVYPDLQPGGYTIWRDSNTPLTTVTITAGAVTTAAWPSS